MACSSPPFSQFPRAVFVTLAAHHFLHLPRCPLPYPQVIYGDTDSIMVYTGSDNLQEVVKLGQQIKREVRCDLGAGLAVGPGGGWAGVGQGKMHQGTGRACLRHACMPSCAAAEPGGAIRVRCAPVFPLHLPAHPRLPHPLFRLS